VTIGPQQVGEILVMTVIILYVICSPSRADVPDVCIGDSITWAPGGWADQIGCENRGVPGAGADTWASSSRPIPGVEGLRVAVLLGTNDAHRGRTSEEFAEDLAAVCDRLEAAASIQIAYPLHVAEPVTAPNFGISAAEANARLESYRPAIDALCDPCGPDLYGLLDRSGYTDGIHLNRLGNEIVAEAWLAMPEPTGGMVWALIALAWIRRIAAVERGLARKAEEGT